MVCGRLAEKEKRDNDMSKRKTRGAFLLALLVLTAVLLAGCKSGEDFPVYQMETREDYTEILYIDSIQYQRDLSGGWQSICVDACGGYR